VRRASRSAVSQVVFILAAGAIGYFLWSNWASLPLVGSGGEPAATAPGAGPPKIPVDVAVARSATVMITVEAVGTARANEAVTVSSEVTGVVETISFEEGQMVSAGDVLIQLNSDVQRADVEVRRAEVELRQAELQNARQLFERAERLIKTDNVSQARYDELAALRRAAEASVKSAQAALRSTEARLVKQRISAPFGGRVGMRHISPGELIEPGNPVVTVDDISVIKLDFQVPERSLASIQIGQEVTARTEAYPDEVFFGRVTTVDTRVDPVTRAVSVRAEMPNADGRLKPGMFLTVELGVDTRPGAVLIPEQALVIEGAARFVFVVDEGGVVKRTNVVTGQRMQGAIEVVEGIVAGQTVVIGGVQKVRDGALVTVREQAQVPETS